MSKQTLATHSHFGLERVEYLQKSAIVNPARLIRALKVAPAPVAIGKLLLVDVAVIWPEARSMKLTSSNSESL